MKLSNVGVWLKLPFLELKGTWCPNESQRKASWKLYVELVTRISVLELRPDEGLLREVLASRYILFDTTRKIQRDYGPEAGRPAPGSEMSFGYIAVAVMNRVRQTLEVYADLLPKAVYVPSLVIISDFRKDSAALDRANEKPVFLAGKENDDEHEVQGVRRQPQVTLHR